LSNIQYGHLPNTRQRDNECGGNTLRGAVPVSGSKNAALPMMAAALLAKGPTILRNVPDLTDVHLMSEILERLGANVSRPEPGTVIIDVVDETPIVAPYELVSAMRASFCVLGPLLSRRGEAHVSMPGGCVLGVRPVDLHMKGIKALGTKMTVERGFVVAKGRPKGGRVYLGGAMGPSVTGTANVLCAAVMGEGVTIIEEAACEPEIQNLVQMLNQMGARIKGGGTPRLEIEGVNELHPTEIRVIPDRIECGTLMLAGAITHGQVTVENCNLDHMGAVLDKYEQVGIRFDRHDNHNVTVTMPDQAKSIDLVTLPYPGFPTDLQSPTMALLSKANGFSMVTEKIYPERFMHVPEYNRMGSMIRKQGATAIIQGVDRLSGCPVASTDLRAGAGLVLAGLVAEDQTEVHKVYHIDRGYHRLEDKLTALGADVRRVEFIPARRRSDRDMDEHRAAA
jgi:UDP-N-acetylglucosamine 1-carboxyvinyltransferase